MTEIFGTQCGRRDQIRISPIFREGRDDVFALFT